MTISFGQGKYKRADALDLFIRDARLAVEQVLPHALVQLLAIAHGQGPFERPARNLAKHVARDVQPEEPRKRTEHGQDAHAEIPQRRELVHGPLSQFGICQGEQRHVARHLGGVDHWDGVFARCCRCRCRRVG